MTYPQICDCETKKYTKLQDPYLPDYMVILLCNRCGFWVEYDTEDNTIREE